MKIVFDLTEEDYRSFYNHHFSQYRLLKFRPFYGALMILMGALYMVWKMTISLLPVFLIFFGTYFVISKFIYIRRATRASRSNPSFSETVQLDIDEEGMSWKSENAHGRFSWSALLGYREFDRGFLLYHQRNAFNMVPLGRMTDSERNTLSSLLSEKLKRL